jgi:hypothetical protein
MQIGLVGHKIDSSRREVSTQEGEQLAAKEHIFYAETTIQDVNSIKSAFKTLITSRPYPNADIIQSQQQQAVQGQELRLDQSSG